MGTLLLVAFCFSPAEIAPQLNLLEAFTEVNPTAVRSKIDRAITYYFR